ncbi:MAG: DNA polymerase I [Firmicutes bacterium]|nr:DNA polymerase I [Bacillota bacterium]
MSNKKRIVIIDGNSLVNRAYYAIQRPMITSDGLYTQGIYGFLSMLGKIRTDYEPTHMLVAFDRKAPTFRHLEYEEYKAGRKKMPLELAMQLPVLKEVLVAMGIFMYEIDGFEADDIIGTTAKMAEDADIPAFIITGDKDALQLATDKTSVIITKKGISEFKLYDDAAMMEEYGFDHIQFIDYKALRGDPSDNIPGIPGVGEKTAVKLIQEYGSLEKLIAGSDSIKNEKLRAKVQDNAQSAMMSKRLATIVTTVPVDYTIEDTVIRPEDTDKLIDLYKRLEFKTYLSKLLKKGGSGTAEKAPASDVQREITIPDVIVISDRTEAKAVLEMAFARGEVTLDIVCDDSHTRTPMASCLEILTGGVCYAVDCIELPDVLRETLEGKKLSLCGFHLGRFYYYLAANGIDISGIETAFDCALAQYVISPSSKAPGLAALLLENFHVNIEEAKEDVQLDLFGGTKKHDNSGRKLRYIDELRILQEQIIKDEGLDKVFYEIELPLCKVLADMENSGFKVDRDSLVEFGKGLTVRIKELEKEIHGLAGEDFNINSPQQLGTVLFEKLGLPAGKKTSRGYSTSADILEKLAPDYPIVDRILEYRTLSKLNGTYVDGMLPLIAEDGKIHAHFQQTVTATGRISCTEPNLQNIPVRTELGSQLRKVFTAESEDHVLIGADYSQIELRVLAHMSKDPTLINCFENGLDIHRETASKVFGVPFDEVTSEMRSNAKAVNFGVIYGMSGFGLASELTISRKQAEKFIKDYFVRFPDVKTFMDGTIAECKKDGYVRTLYGRRRAVPEINASQYMTRQLGERLAMNTPIQGTAADIIKLAMNKVYDALKDVPDARLILQIHDELIIQARREDEEKVRELLSDSMQNAAKLAVKLDISLNTGENWYELK